MAGITLDASGTNAVWYSWVTSATTCTATATATWYAWCGSTTSATSTYETRESDEIKAAREAKAARQKVIEAKAEKWLRDHLSAEQEREYLDTHKFTVISRDGQRRYEITKENAWVYELNAKNERIRSFCIHSRIQLPKADEICAKKILLEADEKEFLKVANATQLRAA
jgi:hypothetical protein